MQGQLYLCATPIGNLEDISYRIINTLNTVDIIAAEDTRHSIKLLNHFDIKTPMTSYHEYNKIEKGKYLVEQLLQGKNIALISDAGTPAISDPGEELVKMCYEADIRVTSIPGPVACITALTISGLSTRRFSFEGFLPYDKKERQDIIQELILETRTIILYEAPHRLLKTLEELYKNLGNRNVSICRELTKRYETVYRSTLEEAIAYYSENQPKGECVVILEGVDKNAIKEEKQKEWLELTVEAHYDLYIQQGMDNKDAMKKVAKDRGISKREVYQALLTK